MERRIAPPGTPELVAVLESMVVASGGRTEAIFRSKQKALMFAAGLGWRLHERRPLDRRGEPIRYTIFESALDDGFINALAVAEEKTLEVLGASCEDKRIQIFEEYAHGGLLELQRLMAIPGDPLEQLLRAVMDANTPETPSVGVTPDLARMFGV